MVVTPYSIELVPGITYQIKFKTRRYSIPSQSEHAAQHKTVCCPSLNSHCSMISSTGCRLTPLVGGGDSFFFPSADFLALATHHHHNHHQTTQYLPKTDLAHLGWRESSVVSACKVICAFASGCGKNGFFSRSAPIGMVPSVSDVGSG